MFDIQYHSKGFEYLNTFIKQVCIKLIKSDMKTCVMLNKSVSDKFWNINVSWFLQKY